MIKHHAKRVYGVAEV